MACCVTSGRVLPQAIMFERSHDAMYSAQCLWERNRWQRAWNTLGMLLATWWESERFSRDWKPDRLE